MKCMFNKYGLNNSGVFPIFALMWAVISSDLMKKGGLGLVTICVSTLKKETIVLQDMMSVLRACVDKIEALN